MLSPPVKGEVQDIDHITEQEVVKIETRHSSVPRRKVNIRPGKKTVIMCIDPDSDSDVIIEEGKTDLKTRYLIVKGEVQEEDEGGKADDEQSKEGESQEPHGEESMSQTAEQKTEDPDKTISSTSMRDFDREIVEKEFVNLATNYQNISDSFAKLVNEVPHMKKRQLATHMAGMPILPLVKVTTEEKVSSMYGQWYSMGEASSTGVVEEYDPKVHGDTNEDRICSIMNSIGERSTLLLIAIGDCMANQRSQAEVAKKYGIPKSHMQQAMLGKREHKKGGKQYRQERKRRLSEEDPGSDKRANKGWRHHK